MKEEKTNNMENNKKMKVVSARQFTDMIREICSKSQSLPLVVFCEGRDESFLQRKMECVSDTVFGDGMMKTILLENGYTMDSDHQIDILSLLPHQLYLLRTPPICDGYDEVTLYAEKLTKASGKHVVLMVPVTNELIKSTGVYKLQYIDHAAKTFQAWRGRAQVWVFDSLSYKEKRQIFLTYQSHGVLDMLKEWSEAGKMDDILRAVDGIKVSHLNTHIVENAFLNEAYTQYVNARKDLPGTVKCAEFHEELFTSEEDTEYGKILTIESQSLSRGGGKDLDYFFLKNKYRMTTELKLTLPQ